MISIEEEKASAFAQVLREQVRELAEEEPGEGIVLDAHLLSVCIGYLEDQGGVSSDVGEDAVDSEDLIRCPFRAKVRNTTLSVLGYLPVSSDGQLTLFTARYEDGAGEKALPVSDYRSRVEQAVRFFRQAYNDPDLLLPFPEVRGLVEHIADNSDRIVELRIVFVTNLRLNARDEKKVDRLGDVIDVAFDTYDVERLHKLSSDALSASDIVIDFDEVIGRPVPCLEATGSDHAYKSYLLILEGTTIHWLFKRYGPRLYDTNLRSYLDNKTKVNKDIIRTVREQPDRFLAYNNGLTATAQEIEVSLVHGQPCISRIVGLQIVNGAQTTGSIFKAREASRKQGDVDLSRVSVSVKLTRVVGDDLREFVPRITRYANTQNPIQAADLEANEELHRKVERLSYDVWCPGTASRWFYERTRGSYQAAMNREGTTPKRKAEFRREVPKDQKFGKTDLARFWMAWNRSPHLVSRGAQKNFDAFKKIISSADGGLPIEAVDESFYRGVVAMALLYRAASAAVTTAGIGGGVGSMAKAYTTSYLAHRLGDLIDLERVWQNQGVSDELQNLLKVWAPQVYERMTLNAGQHTTEWFKKENCWLDVQGLELERPADTLPEYRQAAPGKSTAPDGQVDPEAGLSVGSPGPTPSPADGPAKSQKLSLNLEDDVAVTRALTGADWVKASMWVKDSPGFTGWDENFALSMAQFANRGWRKGYPTVSQASKAARIARSAIRAGVLELA
ncbi:hypothetical protein MMR14E_18810 [Methylobacterium mesophilicum]